MVLPTTALSDKFLGMEDKEGRDGNGGPGRGMSAAEITGIDPPPMSPEELSLMSDGKASVLMPDVVFDNLANGAGG